MTSDPEKPTRVYLDQRDWIGLARVEYGLEKDTDLIQLLDYLKVEVHAGRISIPLSACHYEETYRQKKPERRRRLGNFMADLSRFDSVTGIVELEMPEIVGELEHRLFGVRATEIEPFGRGVGHAFGKIGFPAFQDTSLFDRLADRWGHMTVVEMLERALLVGPPEELPSGDIQLPSNRWDEKELRENREIAEALKIHGHSRDLAHRLVLAQSSVEVVTRARMFLRNEGLREGALFSDANAITDFVMNLPSRGAFTRMRMTAFENPRFAWAKGDLSDVSSLSVAAAYCDVVVCEKKWGDVLQRNRAHLRARVTTRLKDLQREINMVRAA